MGAGSSLPGLVLSDKHVNFLLFLRSGLLALGAFLGEENTGA